MSKKEKTIAVVVAAVVIVFIVVFAFMQQPNGAAPAGNSAPVGSVTPTGLLATKAPVPATATVPNEGDTVVPPGIAVPQVQAPASPVGSASYRQFVIRVEKNAFTPSTLVVHKGDVVDLEILAVDKAYDFTQPDYGFEIPLLQGINRKIQFQALNVGKFTFYCSACGGPASGPVGYVIVTGN